MLSFQQAIKHWQNKMKMIPFSELSEGMILTMSPSARSKLVVKKVRQDYITVHYAHAPEYYASDIFDNFDFSITKFAFDKIGYYLV